MAFIDPDAAQAPKASVEVKPAPKGFVDPDAASTTQDDSIPDRSTWGKREDGSPKGGGFLGVLKRPGGGISTEISIGVPINGKETEIPTLVPTLDEKEKNWLLTHSPKDKMPESIRQKAVAHAEERIKAGKSPFAGTEDEPSANIQGLPIPPDSGETKPTADNLGRYKADAKEEPVSRGKAALKAGAEAIPGAVGGVGGMAAGAEIGGAIGLLGGPAAPVTVPVMAAIGAVTGAFGGSYVADKLYNLAKQEVPMEWLKEVGLDPQTRAREQQQRPYASFAGQLVPNLAFFQPGKVPGITRALTSAVGGGIEAGQELAIEGNVDPKKVAMAAAFQAAAPKATGITRAIEGKAASIDLAIKTRSPENIQEVSKTPLEKAVEPPKEKAAVGAEAPALRKQETSPQPIKEDLLPLPKVSTEGPVMKRVNSLSEGLNTLRNRETADIIKAGEEARKFSDEARSEDIYHNQAEEAGRPLTPELAEIKRTQVDPLVERVNKLYREIKAEHGEAMLDTMEDITGHNIRRADRTWRDTVKSWGENVLGHTSFGRKAGTQKERSMIALEFDDGTRQVANRDGMALHGYVEGSKEKEPLFKGNQDNKPDVGNEITTKDGRKAKVVQATTEEIEAQTPVRYKKDVVANYLIAEAQLKKYQRESAFLKDTLNTLKNEGFAVDKAKVKEAPSGFVSVEGHPSLEKVFVDKRFAEAFEDGISKGLKGSSLLEQFNSAAVGTLFWNPAPHLFNAQDHWFTTVGWDFVKPWQYKSIAKSMYQAIKDVSNVTPEYVRYLESGMGLQYGNVLAKDAIEHIEKTLPKAELDSIAKKIGLSPIKLIDAIYDKSKHALWGGSDIFMLSAYRHMASKKGVDILNQSLKNYVEAHNPNYQIPTRIGYDAMMKIPGMPEAVSAALSRGMSQAMQSRMFNTFGRYHYGQFKSMASSLHDLAVQNENSVTSRADAAQHLAFVAFNVGVVYPYIWDSVAKFVSGDPDAEQRRAGASTIPYTMYHILLGDKDVTALLAEAYSLPPGTKTIAEVLTNRDLFTGEHIWEPGGNVFDSAYDAGKNITSKLIAPIKTGLDILSEKKTAKEAALEQIGVKTNVGQKEAISQYIKQKESLKAKKKRARDSLYRMLTD